MTKLAFGTDLKSVGAFEWAYGSIPYSSFIIFQQYMHKEEIIRHAIANWNIDLNHVLDMGCGSGIVTKILLKYGASEVDSSDPSDYAELKFAERFNKKCLRYSFEDIASGVFPKKTYTLVVCSYSLHFYKSSLQAFLYRLRRLTSTLLVIGPNNRPAIESRHWILTNEYQAKNQAKGRLFKMKWFME